ncbi:glyco protein hormone beta-5 [Trichinella spiralis]|uniref:glyco protein hormone beta-5 n=1 Tax=Trichinella spiralis TaxID=6334 RepID=UPI0001EFCB08|nr:glyco protein hormone beta-5 [Trichinella spiralis]
MDKMLAKLNGSGSRALWRACGYEFRNLSMANVLYKSQDDIPDEIKQSPYYRKSRFDWLFGEGYRRPLAADQGGKMRRGWLAYGFHPTDEYTDWKRAHAVFFALIGIAFPGLVFVLWYKPDCTMHFFSCYIAQIVAYFPEKCVGFASLELTMGTDEPRKTLFSLTPPQKAVLAIAVVVGCFAIVYPKVVHPTICYMLGWSKPPSKAQPGPMPPHMGDHMQARGREKSFWYSLLPFYTIGVIAFLIYTLSKMLRTSDGINERSGRNWRKRNGAPPFGLRDLSDAQLKNLHQRLLETETTMQTILKCLEANGDTKTELKEDIQVLAQDTLQNLEKLTATATRHVLNSEENCNDEYCSDNEEMLVLKDLEKALAQFESFSTDYLKMQNSKNPAAVKNQESEAFEKCCDESDNFRNTEIGVTDESKKER